MGLDMYMEREVYVGSALDKDEDIIDFDGFGGKFDVDKNKIKSFRTEIMYWRKANAIHAWFVKNVQDGEDDCEDYEIPEKKVIELYDSCSKAYLTKDPTEFEPKSGFFFGNTLIDEFYWQDIYDTMRALKPIVDQLKKSFEDRDDITKASDFYYRSSW